MKLAIVLILMTLSLAYGNSFPQHLGESESECISRRRFDPHLKDILVDMVNLSSTYQQLDTLLLWYFSANFANPSNLNRELSLNFNITGALIKKLYGDDFAKEYNTLTLQLQATSVIYLTDLITYIDVAFTNVSALPQANVTLTADINTILNICRNMGVLLYKQTSNSRLISDHLDYGDNLTTLLYLITVNTVNSPPNYTVIIPYIENVISISDAIAFQLYIGSILEDTDGDYGSTTHVYDRSILEDTDGDYGSTAHVYDRSILEDTDGDYAIAAYAYDRSILEDTDGDYVNPINESRDKGVTSVIRNILAISQSYQNLYEIILWNIDAQIPNAVSLHSQMNATANTGISLIGHLYGNDLQNQYAHLMTQVVTADITFLENLIFYANVSLYSTNATLIQGVNATLTENIECIRNLFIQIGDLLSEASCKKKIATDYINYGNTYTHLLYTIVNDGSLSNGDDFGIFLNVIPIADTFVKICYQIGLDLYL